MVPPEQFFGLIPNGIVVYLVSILAFGVASLMMWRRVIRLVLLGHAEPRFDQPMRRLWNATVIVLGQRKVLQRVSPRDLAGLGHVVIFIGFLLMTLSYAIFIAGDSAWSSFSETVLTETGVRILASFIDFVAAAILMALTWAISRRWIVKPHRLSFDLTRNIHAVIPVALIYLLMVLTLLTEGFYVAAGATDAAAQTPIGGALGRLFESMGLSASAANGLHAVAWWLHLINILGFSIYIPTSKHMHMFAAPVNAFFTTLTPRGTLKPMPDLETAESFGAGSIAGFTWKSLLDGYACAVCGRCTDSCPANISGKVLSPMHIAEGIKDQLLEVGPQILAAKARGEEFQEPDLIREGSGLNPTAIWDCVTCGACMEECPVAVEHVDSIIEMRRYLVMEKSEMPEGVMNTLVNLEQRGHPWRGTPSSRTDWMEGTGVKTLAEEPDVEVLLWVGCTPALNESNQRVPRAMASLLRTAGVKFGVLGNEETCSGDPARRMGNEYLFQMMAEQNIETFNRYSVKKIITLCPHCFNNIKNEYPQLGGDYKVYHYTEYIDELIQEGRLKLLKTVDMEMTYHDSCYLGRHNKVYDAPRRIAAAIPGLTLHEMERNRGQGFCCGAGGGHMWMEESGGQRINHMRTDQFLETPGDTLAVSCPFCLQMFDEGISSKGLQDSKQAKDLAEIVAESVSEGEVTGAG